MEPQIPSPTPIPLPPSSVLKEFRKSKIILFLAYAQLIFYVTRFIFFLPGLHSFSFISILLIIPAFLVIFTKNKTLYRIARIILIVELILIILPLLALLFIFANF